MRGLINASAGLLQSGARAVNGVGTLLYSMAVNLDRVGDIACEMIVGIRAQVGRVLDGIERDVSLPDAVYVVVEPSCPDLDCPSHPVEAHTAWRTVPPGHPKVVTAKVVRP